MAEGYNFRLNIPWYILEKHFKEEKEHCQDKCMELDDKELYRMQGEARVFKRLANLPEQLIMKYEGKE